MAVKLRQALDRSGAASARTAPALRSRPDQFFPRRPSGRGIGKRPLFVCLGALDSALSR